MKGYFVISTGPDGTHVSAISKEELEKRLNEQYWGDEPRFAELGPRTDFNYGSHIYIIKGETVLPREVSVVTKYEV